MNKNSQNLALELKGISRHFGALKAVQNVDLQVAKHERRAILGSNGAGKTTLFNLITGDLLPSFGTINFFGRDISKMPVRQRIRGGLRRTYQITALFNGLSVLDNVYLACRGVDKNRFSLLRPSLDDPLMQEAIGLIERVHLTKRQGAMVSELSYGEQRQLEIALALAGAPKFILFDEPAAGLSPREREQLVEILQNLPKDLGFIIIEHDMDVALKVADRVSVMHNGEIFKEGTPEEVVADEAVQNLYLGDDHG